MHLRLGRAGSIINSFTNGIICIVPMCVHSLCRNGSFGFFGRALRTVMICETVGGSTPSSSIKIEENPINSTAVMTIFATSALSMIIKEKRQDSTDRTFVGLS
jgi:hypothetical protein